MKSSRAPTVVVSFSVILSTMGFLLAASLAEASVISPLQILLTWTQGPDGAYNSHHTAFYDPHRHSMLVYNDGASSELPLTGAAEWYGFPLGSPDKTGPVVFDPLRRRWLIIPYGNGAPAQVWQQPFGGTTISQLAVSGTPPSGTENAAFFDPVRNRLLYFTQPNVGWQLSLTGTPTWSPLVTSGTPPSFIYGENAVYDPIGDRLLVVNGDLAQLPLAGPPVWSHQAIAGTGGGHGITFDTRNNRLYFFGYSQFMCVPFCYTEWYNDTWAVTLTGPIQWVHLSSNGAGPHGRELTSLMHDPINDRLVLYAGYWEGIGQYYMNDTWFMDMGNFFAPDFDATPTEVDFGTVGALGTYTTTIDVSNIGNRPGVVFAVASSDPSLTVDATAFPLPATGARTLTITWTPPTGMTLDATVEIESNDPDTPSWVIPVTGTATGSSGVDPVGARGFRLALAGANPVRGVARFDLSLPARARADVAVYDVRGSLVKSLAAGDLGPGQQHFDWDGTDAGGRRVAAGLYFVRATSGGKSSQVKVAFAR